MELYTPALVLGAIAAVFAVFSVAMSAVVGPRRYNQVRVESYECGIQPVAGADRGGKVHIRFYTVAMTFIIFDVEIMFLVPWAIHFDAMGFFGLVAMVLFLVTITIAYVYEWRRGGLDWD